MIFVSGSISLNRKGKIVGRGDVKAQARQAFENTKIVLAAAGASFRDVVKVTYYLRNMKDLTEVFKVRQEYFTDPNSYPAATGVEVSGLASEEALIEIDVIAMVH